MKQPNLISILLTFFLLLLTPNLAAALIDAEATKIPYQVNNSDRIIIGTVSEIDTYSSYTIFTIAVKEWLYNPLPADTIKVRTETGTNFWTEDEVELTQNESALLMLKDENLDKMLFRVPLGLKYPVSDRDAVIEALKAQGKWKEEGLIADKTNESGIVESNGTAGKLNGESNATQKSNNIPFISFFWVLIVLLGAGVFLRNTKKE